jgi:transposase-like protein
MGTNTKKAKRYTDEQRAEILAFASNHTLQATQEKYGVAPITVANWKQQVRAKRSRNVATPTKPSANAVATANKSSAISLGITDSEFDQIFSLGLATYGKMLLDNHR